MTALAERDKLIWKLAHTAHSLTDAIRMAVEMDDAAYAVEHLRASAAVGRALLRGRASGGRKVGRADRLEALLREAHTRLMVSEGDARYIDNNVELAKRIEGEVDV